jgi:acetyltransferase-like isoleucine patch superfamily enzyme
MISMRAVLRTNCGGSITIGAHCDIHDFSMIMTYGGDIKIGDNCSLNPFSIIYGHGGTKIGCGVRIASHSVIIPANHVAGNDEKPLYQRPVSARGIEIGDYTWIATGCTILDGVAIGRHVIVGAGSVVTRSLPDGATVVGVPARWLA